MRNFVLSLVAAFLFSIPSFADPVTATVIYVFDGDTAEVEIGKEKVTCRLYGIDAPETTKPRKPGQPYGKEAKEALKSMLEGKPFKVAFSGEQTYEREVCHFTRGKEDLNLKMIELGFAWAYRKHLKEPYRTKYIKAEEKAKKQKRGLWQGENPIFPGRFKHLFW